MILAENVFSVLGDNFILIIILAAELLAAIFLIGAFVRNKLRSRRTVVASVMPGFFANEPFNAALILKSYEKEPLFVAANFEKVMGISPQKLKGDIECLNSLSDDCRLFDLIDEWDGKEPLVKTFSLHGTDKYMRMSAARNPEKGTDVIVFTDVTSYMEQSAELEEQIRIAKGESVKKTRFLSRMSHEIRTPMNGIIGMLLLAKKQLDGNTEVLSFIEKAEGLSKYLLSVINDILDLSRIEAGKLELEAKPLDLRDIADKLDNMFRETIEGKGIRFSIEFQNFENTCVVGDDMRISQVLVNLLSNASKFTSEGEISVTFRQMLEENGKVDFMVLVHDTGIGMKPEFLKRIFNTFEQESVDVTKKYGGSGLGMAITDNIVRIMGGSIVINSMPDKGSDFSVFLSLPKASRGELPENGKKPGEAETDEQEYSYEGKHILLAEDNEINAEIVVGVLSDCGAVVDVAQNGKICVEMFEKSDIDYYDLILMDVQMPVMDGREAARRIRALGRQDAKRVYIFALSADAFVEDKRLSVAAGMDGHFSKPVDFAAMKKELGTVRRR